MFIDDDECEEKSHRCHTHATCYNTRGSYKCDCNEGFTGSGFNCEGSVESIGLLRCPSAK